MATYNLSPDKWAYSPPPMQLLMDASAGGVDEYSTNTGQQPMQPHYAQFDLSSVVGTLISATLHIVAANNGNGLARMVSRVTEGWSVGGFPPEAGAEPSTLFNADTSCDVNVAALVAGWRAGSYANYGLRILQHGGIAVPWELTTLELEVVTYGDGEPPPGGDETDPVVTIIAPEEAAEVAGDVIVEATITDNVGVVLATLEIDGQLQSALAAPNSGANWRWSFASDDWANGSHTLLVQAWDLAGNMGSDSVTVTVNNSLADMERVRFTEPVPDAAYPYWEQDKAPSQAVLSPQKDDAPANPARTYNLRGYVMDGSLALTPGVIPAGAYPVEFDRVHGCPVADTVRWAIKGTPAQVLAFWEVEAADIVAMCLYGVGPGDPTYVAMLGGDSILRGFDGTAVTELADLSGYVGDPHDVAWVDGKLLVGIGAKLIAYDLDAGEVTLEVGFPDVTAVRQIEAAATGAWVAGDIAGGGRLLAFSWDSTVVVGDVEQILTLAGYSGGALVAIGCAGGKVYASAGAAPVLAYATGEDDVRSILALTASQVLAGTGNGGIVFHSSPAWEAETTLTMGEVRALGTLGSAVYAGGDSAFLWRRASASSWVQALELAEINGVNCMIEYTDPNGRTALLIGTGGVDTGGGYVSRVYRLEVSAASEYQTGPSCPDAGIPAVRMRTTA